MAHKYTQEEIKFMLDYCSTHSYKETQQEFNEKFNTHISIPAVKYMCNTRGVYAYGIKQDISLTPKTKSVGTEWVDPDGYVYIKIAEPNKWRLKHYVEWEKYNKPIEKNEVIFFLDRNRQNCNINNLAIVPKSYTGCFNKMFNSNVTFTQESFATALLACKLYLDAKEKKRKQTRENPKHIVTEYQKECARLAQMKRWSEYGKVNKK